MPSDAPSLTRVVEAVGRAGLGLAGRAGLFVHFVGDATRLVGQTSVWFWRTAVRRESHFGMGQLMTQMVRVGIRSIPIVMLLQVFIGIILALQMAPPLQDFGQVQSVATIVAIAVFRELGPLISGVVLSGFAGASIAAELGTMVEGEEIKALKASAISPVRFLVMPRIIATVVMLTALTVVADAVGIFGGFLTGTLILNLDYVGYLNLTREAVTHQDFLTGLVKAAVFGLMISVIACQQGLSVSGGAEGVGRATTATVVKSIVALITADVLFTAVFYAYGI